METVQGFPFVRLRFDSAGNGSCSELLEAASSATDVVLISHGFRNDENEAFGLYSEFLGTFRANMARGEFGDRLTSRKWLIGGVFWPSQSFREISGEGNVQGIDDETPQREAVRAQLMLLKAEAPADKQPAVDEALALVDKLQDREEQDRFVELVLSLLQGDDPAEGVQRMKAQAGSELLDKLSLPIIVPTEQSGDEGGAMSVGDEGQAQGFIGGFVGSVFGRVGQFLNMTTWYVMKERSGTVGSTGVATCVRELKKALPSVRVHLVGHSLGGRLMAACAKSLTQDPAVQADSLTLLQAAFSHFGLSADNREGTPGFFRDAIVKRAIKGPMVATFSFQDTVVGRVYAIASRLAGDNVKAIGDRDDPYGGIGRNGAVDMQESRTELLKTPSAPYTFNSGQLLCLDGSGGLITNHSDIRNANVTYAFACAAAASA